MTVNPVLHLKHKYNGYCPLDRRSIVFHLAIPLGPDGPGLFGAPFVVEVKWEWPEDAVASYTVEQIDDIMGSVEKGLALIFAGAERMVWQREREDILNSARKTAAVIIESQKTEERKGGDDEG